MRWSGGFRQQQDEGGVPCLPAATTREVARLC